MSTIKQVTATNSNPQQALANASLPNNVRPATTKTKVSSNNIKVTVHIPENVIETVRQQKINLIYDILSPKVAKVDI